MGHIFSDEKFQPDHAYPSATTSPQPPANTTRALLPFRKFNMDTWNLVYDTATGQGVSLGTVLANPLPANLTALELSEQQSTAILSGAMVWDAATLSLIPTPRHFVTAIEHLESVGFGSNFQPTLLYLRLNLAAANKSCVELSAVESYLQGILTIFAQDQNPRNDWAMPPFTFDEVVISAMSELSS